MSKWDVYKYDDDKAFTITIQNNSYVVDCFEFVLHKLAPFCGRYECRVIGHGIYTPTLTYCSNYCAAAGILASLPVAP